jgi:hypothetical protein
MVGLGLPCTFVAILVALLDATCGWAFRLDNLISGSESFVVIAAILRPPVFAIERSPRTAWH